MLFTRFKIFDLVPDILKFKICVKYANEMIDDVIHSTQYYIKYINRTILANLQRRLLTLNPFTPKGSPFDESGVRQSKIYQVTLGSERVNRLIVLQETHLQL